MNKGDTFTHQGVTYTVTTVLGEKVMGIAEVEATYPIEADGEMTKAHRRIVINIADITP